MENNLNETKQTSDLVIAITGASGHLGRLVVESLLGNGFPGAQIVAVVRDPKKIADFAARGVQVRRADYAQPEALRTAFAGVNRLLLVSSNEVNERLRSALPGGGFDVGNEIMINLYLEAIKPEAKTAAQ